MAAAMRKIGVVPALVLIKAVSLGVFGWVLYPIDGGELVAAGVCLFYVYVVFHNWRQYTLTAR